MDYLYLQIRYYSGRPYWVNLFGKYDFGFGYIQIYNLQK
jgi:hypothetical protein